MLASLTNPTIFFPPKQLKLCFERVTNYKKIN